MTELQISFELDDLNIDQSGMENDLVDVNSPRYPTYFNKRICVCYVDNKKEHLCAGCQKNKEYHDRENYDETFKWNYKECTELQKTDAYGTLTFPGSHSKSAKYLRIEIETNVEDILEYLYAPEGWSLQRPNLIISVTGGAQKFTIPQRMKKAFKSGLIKAASSTGAWIITGGTNTGVMRLVGEAVADEYHKNNNKLTVLGIATWGKIALREQMIVKDSVSHTSFIDLENGSAVVNEEKGEILYAKKENENNEDDESIKPLLRKQPVPPQGNNTDIFLDPNHNHFLLVDDGSEGQFGKEIEFRARLENEIRKGKSIKYYENKRKRRQSRSILRTDMDDLESAQDQGIPMILIVVQGGPNTLLTVEETIKENIPVLILADSKGCADLIANACSSPKHDNLTLKRLVEESKMYEKLKGIQYEKKVAEAVAILERILSKLPQNLVNVFKLDSEEGAQDIEMWILNSLLKLRKNQHFDNLKLALQWNRDDIAKNYIFTGEEEFKTKQLKYLMELALIQNKPKFVELLLENGLDLKSFLTAKRLLFLYNSQNIHLTAKKAPLFQLYKRRYLPAKKIAIITFNGLKKFLIDYLYEDFNPVFLENLLLNLDLNQTIQFLKKANKANTSHVIFSGLDENFSAEVLNPAKNLFVWALLMNRIEIAKIFWQIGEHQICTALFASTLLKSIGGHLADLENELLQQADVFENMACGVLNIFDNVSDDLINGVILLQKVPYYSTDCLQIAFEGKCLKFLSLISVQNLLTDIWNGKINDKTDLKSNICFVLSCLSFGILAPFCMFERKSNIPKASDHQNKLNKLHVSKNKKLKASYYRYHANLGKRKINVLKDYFLNDETEPTYEPGLMPDWLRHLCFKRKDDKYSSNKEADDDENIIGMKLLNPESDDQNKKIEDDHDNNDQDVIKVKKTKFQIYISRYRNFINSPKVHFVYDTFFFVVFLLLFSYMMLCEFEYYDTESSHELEENSEHFDLNHTNSSFDSNSKTLKTSLKKDHLIRKLSVIEYIVTVWIFTFIIEELRQFIFSDTDKKFSTKLFRYFDDNWNYIDFYGCLIFFIGLVFRFVSLVTSEKIFITARIIYAFDLAIWYTRLLHVTIIFKSLGPKLVMIQKMIYDLMFFLIIIIIFVCSFGVATQATMYPGNELNLKLIKNMINKAYWPIYGEMRILDEIEDAQTCSKEGESPETIGSIFSYVALMLYMVVANVLLINLLIAMFSATFQDVQDNTDQIWKYQRYKLVFEYYDSSIFPPPFSVMAYIGYLIKIIRNKKNSQDNNNFLQDEDELFLERKFAEEYLRNERKIQREKVDSRLKVITNRLDGLEQKLNEMMENKYKEKEQFSTAINWLMSKFDGDSSKAPYITNVE